MTTRGATSVSGVFVGERLKSHRPDVNRIFSLKRQGIAQLRLIGADNSGLINHEGKRFHGLREMEQFGQGRVAPQG
jgi:hypothetical protein